MLPVMILSFGYLILRQALQPIILVARGERAYIKAPVPDREPRLAELLARIREQGDRDRLAVIRR